MTEIAIETALEVCTNTNEVLELAGLCGAEEAGATLFGQLCKNLSESARMCYVLYVYKLEQEQPFNISLHHLKHTIACSRAQASDLLRRARATRDS